MPIIGRTLEEAEAKLEKARKNFSVNGGLARFCGFTNVDLSPYGLDEEFDFEGKKYDNSIQGVIQNIQAIGALYIGVMELFEAPAMLTVTYRRVREVHPQSSSRDVRSRQVRTTTCGHTRNGSRRVREVVERS